MATAARKVIVITGATRGLGRALAEGFARLGHVVVGCGRSAEELERLRRDLDAPDDFAVVDVTREDQVASWAERTLTRHGPPDLLLNNAAAINRNAPLWEVPADEFDRVIDVNLKGVAHVIRHFVPAMIARKSGVVVNVSSTWGRSTSREVAPYCATKWAIEGLTRGAGAGAAIRTRRRPPQPRDHRHGDASKHIWRTCRTLPWPRGMGEGRCPVPAGTRSPG